MNLSQNLYPYIDANSHSLNLERESLLHYVEIVLMASIFSVHISQLNRNFLPLTAQYPNKYVNIWTQFKIADVWVKLLL